jgi:regulator of protease activity HflC (stomatin/prohibitin superfamily)
MSKGSLPKLSDIPAGPVKLALICFGVMLVLSLAALLKPFAMVKAGDRGVIFNKFKGVDTTRNLPEGMHFIIPLVESVRPMTVQVQKNTFNTAASSKDLQQVATEVVINFHLDPDNVARLYQEVGEDYISKLIEPSVQESIKAVTAEYNATDLIAKRPQVKKQAQDVVTERLNKYHILVNDFSITDFKFSPEFEKAIEAKQVAEQEALQKNYELQKAKKDAEIAITQAEAKKTSTITLAQGDAESQRLLRQTLTPELIELRRIEKWDGKYPQVLGGEAIQMFSLAGETAPAK